MLRSSCLFLGLTECLGNVPAIHSWYQEDDELGDTVCMQQLYLKVFRGRQTETGSSSKPEQHLDQKHILGLEGPNGNRIPQLAAQTQQNATVARVSIKKTATMVQAYSSTNPHIAEKQILSPSGLGGQHILQLAFQTEHNKTFVHVAAKKPATLVQSYSSTKHTSPNIHGLAPVALGIVIFAVLLHFGGEAVMQSYSDDTRNVFQVITCFLGLTGVFSVYGVLQEYIMTNDYDGGKFPSAMFLVVINRVVAIVVVLCIMAWRGTAKTQWVLNAWSYAAFPALTGLLGSWCQHNSLLYITFPSQVVFKSSKIIPTMILSTIMNGQRHGCRDYGVAAVVTASVTGFFLCTEKENRLFPEDNTVIGILMMVLFLISDCLTSTTEKNINVTFPDFDNAQMMLAMSSFTVILGSFAILMDQEVYSIFYFLQRNPEALVHVFAFGCSSTAGQYLILHTIRTLGPVPLVIMMTLRQMVGIVISHLLYNHVISWQGYACAGIAFIAIIIKPLGKLHASFNETKTHS